MRMLTPLGKIAIINTLCNSQFIYRLQCLPSPSKKLFKKLKKIIKGFIWDNKKAKIAYDRLVLPYKDGGLQLKDLELTDISLKLAKFKVFCEKDFFWTHFLRCQFPVSKEHFLKLNFSPNDVCKFCRPSFFTDMCFYWAQNNFCSPTTCNEIMSEILWFNSHIRHQNKWCFSSKLYLNGIIKVVDLFDLDTGRFLTYTDFCELYGPVINFLEFFQIIQAIPQSWKQTLLRNQPGKDTQETWRAKFMNTKLKPSRFCYNHLLQRKKISNSGLITIWNHDLKENLDENGFSRLLVNLRKITSSTKLQYFQYRILVKKLTTNIQVSKWDQTISSDCTFCKSSPETIVHLFFECTSVKKLWKAMSKWFKHFHSINLSLSVSTILLNNYKGKLSALVNFYIVVCKYYVYRVKTQGKKLSFQDLMSEITKYKNIEKIIAYKNDKLYKFARRWNDFDVFL